MSEFLRVRNRTTGVITRGVRCQSKLFTIKALRGKQCKEKALDNSFLCWLHSLKQNHG